MYACSVVVDSKYIIVIAIIIGAQLPALLKFFPFLRSVVCTVVYVVVWCGVCVGWVRLIETFFLHFPLLSALSFFHRPFLSVHFFSWLENAGSDRS